MSDRGQKILGYIMVMALTAAAVFAGYKFLSIRADFLFAEKPEPQPVITVQGISEEQYVPEAPAAPADDQATIQAIRETKRADLVKKLEEGGAKVIDSKLYNRKEDCDAAVKKIMAEYIRRGLPETDISETAPFPDSAGMVIVYKNADALYYAGCYAPEFLSWAVYVHFIPNTAAVGQ